MIAAIKNLTNQGAPDQNGSELLNHAIKIASRGKNKLKIKNHVCIIYQAFV